MISAELFKAQLAAIGLPQDSTLLDVRIDHEYGAINIVVEDPNARPVPECCAVLTERLETNQSGDQA